MNRAGAPFVSDAHRLTYIELGRMKNKEHSLRIFSFAKFQYAQAFIFCPKCRMRPGKMSSRAAGGACAAIPRRAAQCGGHPHDLTKGKALP